MLCDKYKQCSDCTMGLKVKKIEIRMTGTMGYGLFACENILKHIYHTMYRQTPRYIKSL